MQMWTPCGRAAHPGRLAVQSAHSPFPGTVVTRFMSCLCTFLSLVLAHAFISGDRLSESSTVTNRSAIVLLLVLVGRASCLC